MLAARGVVIPQVPRLWPLPPAAPATLDYAESSRADAWLRHPILGDPSFDSFQHHANNPLVTGVAPFQWPVNVSLLEDPRSGRWYAYVGHYLAGYDVGPDAPCVAIWHLGFTENPQFWPRWCDAIARRA
ncbi:MAG: hypothetical protein ABSE73_15720, partial [Planctomycetota bacterium]